MANTFKQTYLYIKQHTLTGKLYFGKTTRKDPVDYLGSGRHWVRHINKHGREHVINLWYCLFIDEESCTEFALLFSKQNNIVVSVDWLNLKLENGLDGGVPEGVISEETRLKLSKASMGNKNGVGNKNFLGKKHSTETKKKLSEIGIGRKGTINKYALGYKHPKVICPHCKKAGAKQLMKRYHFENCKCIDSISKSILS